MPNFLIIDKKIVLDFETIKRPFFIGNTKTKLEVPRFVISENEIKKQ